MPEESLPKESLLSEEDERRYNFLIAMYNQLWGNINRHINLIWQPIALLITIFGLLFLSKDGTIDFNLSVSLIIIFVGWFIAHVYDSSHWYNRNLIIISNIEKQFLRKSDVEYIHPYFIDDSDKKSDFDEKRMITHFKLQLYLGIIMLIIIILFYIINTIEQLNSELKFILNLEVCLPIVLLILVTIWLQNFKKKIFKKYKFLKEKSPGKEI